MTQASYRKFQILAVMNLYVEKLNNKNSVNAVFVSHHQTSSVYDGVVGGGSWYLVVWFFTNWPIF